MIKYTKDDKTLVVPSGLGNLGQSSGSGGGVTPQQAAEIASAVTEAAIDEYDTEIQVDLEELRDAISASTGTLLDLATIAAMSIADRVALFDEVFEKVSNGEKVYIKGLVQEETIRTAILPLVSYRPETNPVLHQGGNLYFAAKGDTDNVYFHIALTSEGTIDPTSGNIIKRNIYNLPTASAEVKGGVRIGSGLTMTQDTLSVDTTGLVTDGDLAPFIVQQSANTQDIASLSAATEAISESLGNYATTAVTNELATAISGVSDSLANYATTATTDALSAVTSALTENLEALSAVTSGLTEAVAGKQDTLSAGNGIDLSGNTISVKIGEGLAFSGDTLVASGGTGGGIEKVSSLPVTAEEGDVVWLEGASRTGYTIRFAENVGDAGWPWELDMEVFTLDGNSASARYDGWLGRWRKFSQYNGYSGDDGDIIVRPRIVSNNAVLDIVVINGSHTIGLGENGISMTSDVEFPGRGCLYVYTGGKWYSKPTFEWEYNQSEAVAFLDKIRGGIEDFDADNFVMRYAVNGVSREFKITAIAHYGVDFQASDDRGTLNGEWGKLSILNYRIGNDGSIADLVGEHWTLNAGDVRNIDISFARFGSDGRGYLTYDADNDRFEYDSAYVATGDTSNACPDLVDWLLTKQGLVDGGLIFDYICVQNTNKLFVVSGGTTYTYSHPAIGFVELASPYTIGDYTFGYEITYKYSDWEMKIDMSESNNVGANIRITAL